MLSVMVCFRVCFAEVAFRLPFVFAGIQLVFRPSETYFFNFANASAIAEFAGCFSRGGLPERLFAPRFSVSGSLRPRFSAPVSSSSRMVSAMRFLAVLTSSIFTFTTSPAFTTSRGSWTNLLDRAEMCTKPS